MSKFPVGTMTVRCPECSDEVGVPILGSVGRGSDGVQAITVEPDLTDVWAHAWTHQGRSEEA